MINQYQQQDDKGLFTFYREQAELEEQLKIQKKERKLQRLKERQQRQLQKQLERKAQEEKQQLKKKQEKLQQERRQKLIESVPRKPLHEPKYRKDRFDKQRIGQSVIVVSSLNNQSRLGMNSDRGLQKSRESLRRIEDMINARNNNRYFLQNKELPVQFGSSLIEKEITTEENKNTVKQVSIRLSYFNKSGEQLQISEMENKRIGGISYDRLPEIIRKSQPSPFILSAKKYKSQKIDQALKSSNSEVIRGIRKSMNEQLMLHRLKQKESSFINFNQQSYQNQLAEQRSQSRQKTYGEPGNLQSLNEKQKKLMEIIHNNYLNKKRN